MNTRAIRSALLSTLSVALALASGSALAISFRLTDLGTLGGTFSRGDALNASGQVTGSSSTTGNQAQHAFLWNGTTMQDLGTLGGSFSRGGAINASGQVTGGAQNAMGAVTPFYGTARRWWTSARWGVRKVVAMPSTTRDR